jgi:dTDP-4-dehydrorhamnose reductase
VKLEPTTRVYIAGCGGMLGEAVYEQFNSRSQVLATDIDVNEPWLSPADVRDFAGSAQVVRSFKPDLIINLAALTDLEFCERNPDNAWLTNGLGAENLGLLANELDVPYVYISTAGIFDGAQEYYTDFDQPNPLGVYAKSKAHGEAWTVRTVRRSYVIRAGWMMGGGPRKDKKFVNKLWKQLQAGAKELAVVRDKLGTPTYTLDFARGIVRLVESDVYGLYNQVCGGSGSRYDVAVAMIQELGLSGSVKVKEVSSDHFKTEYFAPRPPSEKLLNVKLDARGLNVMRDWRVCLSEYLKRFQLR